jgi:hypothetical protein
MHFRQFRRLLVACIATILVVPLLADDLVLVPVWYNGRGSEGSNWTTHLSAFSTARGYMQPSDRGMLPCQWLANPCPRGFFEDKMIVYQAIISAAGGFVMSVPDADRVNFSLRVFEASAWREDLGVSVPVVRERDMFSGPVQLMNIPRADVDLFRYTLRVYGIGNAPRGAAVRLNGYLTMADGTPDLVMTRDVRMVPIPNGLGHWYFEDATFVHDLVFAVGEMGSIRVEIEPFTQNMRWWGIVSTTNKKTQDVTIVTPE